MLTQHRLKQLLDYDAATGVFTWKVRARSEFSTERSFKVWNRRYAGHPAGSDKGHGYLYLRIDGRQYYLHRLAWLWVTGAMPKHEIDHIDHDTRNNCFLNLREVGHQGNLQNQKMRLNNKSGVMGVCRYRGNRWQASIGTTKLGIFSSFDDAVAARKIALMSHQYHQNHGASS